MSDTTHLAEGLDEAFRRLDNLDQLVRDATAKTSARLDKLEALIDAENAQPPADCLCCPRCECTCGARP
jgi:hypothetical protein